jgi:hypothetical protein
MLGQGSDSPRRGKQVQPGDGCAGEYWMDSDNRLADRGGIPCRRTRFSWGSEDGPLYGGFVLRVKMHARAGEAATDVLFFLKAQTLVLQRCEGCSS